jgi:hypothetical protein
MPDVDRQLVPMRNVEYRDPAEFNVFMPIRWLLNEMCAWPGTAV